MKVQLLHKHPLRPTGNVLKSPKEEGFREKIRDRSVPEATARSVAERVLRLRSAKTVQVQVVDVSRSIKEVGTDSNSGVSPVGSVFKRDCLPSCHSNTP